MSLSLSFCELRLPLDGFFGRDQLISRIEKYTSSVLLLKYKVAYFVRVYNQELNWSWKWNKAKRSVLLKGVFGVHLWFHVLHLKRVILTHNTRDPSIFSGQHQNSRNCINTTTALVYAGKHWITLLMLKKWTKTLHLPPHKVALHFHLKHSLWS